jgi:hypothetical protein
MELECPICTEIIVDPFKTSCCNQEIHSACFDKCINLNGSCPFCRTNGNQNNQRIIIINNPLIIQRQRRTNYCAFCASIIFCFFMIFFISGLIGFPLGIYYVSSDNDINFTKYNNTLNLTEN